MSRLTDDYERLRDNEFYKLLIEKIEGHKNGRVNSLESAELESVSKIQGEVMALKWVLSCPKNILDSILKEK